MTVTATAATTDGKDVQVDGSNIVATGAPAAGALDGYALTATGSSIRLQSDQFGVVAQTPTDLSGERLSTVIVGDDSTSNVFIQGTGTGRGVLAGRATVDDINTPGQVTVLGREIEVRADRSHGVYAALDSTVTIGSDSTDSFTVSTTSGMGVSANEGQVVITAKNVEISSQNYFAVHAGNRTTGYDPATDETASVRINAEHTTIRGLVGIANYSDGRIDIDGDVTIDAVYAMNVRGGSLTNINADGTHTVVVNGQIQFAASDDKTPIDATVNLNLTGAESSWTGNVQYDFEESVDGPQDVTGFNLTIADGATWNVQNYSVSGTEKQGSIDQLNFNDGVIATETAEQVVHVETIAGSGGQLNLAAEKTADSFTTSSLRIDNADESVTLDVSFVGEGINADTMTEADLDAAAKNAVVVGEGASDKVTQVQRFAEGNIRGAVTQVVNGSEVARSEAQNAKLESFQGVNASALVLWRNQINHLTKRLGDVRHQSGEIGAWARVYGGEYKWGDTNRVDMQTTTVQVGGDARVGDWIVGGAFSYSDSSYDLDNGDGDGDLYSLAVYGTRMFEKGSYVDFVARYGYIKNDIQAGNMGVDFDSNAFSLSVEGGHTFKFMERAYVEPQIEVTYGFAQGDDATASNGVKIEQDDYQNLITRIGFRTGFDFPKNAGTIYAHASYSYDFLGEAEGTASQDGLRASLDEDLGGGWVTYGIGGQFRLGESTFAYGELERSTGGDVDNPWAFNVGLRHLF